MNMTAEMTRTERRPYTEDEIVVGAPATNYVGSDSYASVVVGVERFKSGPRAGRVKAIIACHVDIDPSGALIERPHNRWAFDENGQPTVHPEYDRFLARDVTYTNSRYDAAAGQWVETKTTKTRYESRCSGKPAPWDSLVVGYAEDYRDPHF